MNLLKLKTIAAISLIFWLGSCRTVSKNIYDEPYVNSSVEYMDLKNWAAHPDKNDPSDRVPTHESASSQEELTADVFFIHPTTFTGKRKDNVWNAKIGDEKLNKKTDETTILFQASIFNSVGRIYAPRYRQAHLNAFYTNNRSAGLKALELAYIDVKEAFQYYLDNFNRGRPIIIASHSQGTYHAKKLVKEFFDGGARQKDLVAAYLVGMPVEKGYFDSIELCGSYDETGCFVSWRTFQKNYIPHRSPVGEKYAVSNPLTWDSTSDYAPKSMNLGAVLRKFDKVYEHIVDAQIHNGILWVSKPKFPWSFLFTRKNYHIADYNFFYYNVQQNASDRLSSFLGE